MPPSQSALCSPHARLSLSATPGRRRAALLSCQPFVCRRRAGRFLTARPRHGTACRRPSLAPGPAPSFCAGSSCESLTMILLPVTVYLLRLYFIFTVCMYVSDTVFYCTFCTRCFSSFHVLLFYSCIFLYLTRTK